MLEIEKFSPKSEAGKHFLISKLLQTMFNDICNAWPQHFSSRETELDSTNATQTIGDKVISGIYIAAPSLDVIAHIAHERSLNVTETIN